ncbi:hypothetical protein CMUS01_11570 [Colletotrichum musicola]|uniref:F-box domain-containing protein n=1 Tax=Colletotrichum musicola TaxID=2175873 RepID=A0A8H6JX61_9PEZI|nr:hypothetical protein CMUS01_11570 [Colletotrichum musicola]
MKLRSQTRREWQENIRWTRLPAEIRITILQLVETFAADEKHTISRWATVSKEWQSFFEPAIWRILTLQSGNKRSGLLGLREHTQSDRTEMIKNISLCVKIEHYICPRCNREIGDQHTIINREKKLFNNLRRLFSILGDWPNEALSMSTGILLRLNAKEPRGRKRSRCKTGDHLQPMTTSWSYPGSSNNQLCAWHFNEARAPTWDWKCARL